MEINRCRYPDKEEGEENMFGALLKGLLSSLAPAIKPILEDLVKKAIAGFLRNLGGGSTSSGVMSLTVGVTQDEMDRAVDKVVQELMES